MSEVCYEMNKKFWAKEVCRGNLIWPDECVIRFAHKNVKPGAVIMDYGCGAGRHSIALAQDGYNMIAVDYNKEALEIVEEKKGSLPVTLVHSDMQEKPDSISEIDGIVAHGSLFYNEKEDTIKILSNLCKCLKKGGKIWGNWRTDRDSLYKNAQLQENGLYKVHIGNGIGFYYFPNEDGLREIYHKSGFEIESMEVFEYTENNQTKLNSWYHVTARKI